MNLNWESIGNSLSGTKKQGMKAEYFPDGVSYFRLKPYVDAEGNSKLFRKFFHHWVSVPVKVIDKDTKEETTEIKKRVVPCEGADCRFCKMHEALHAANIRDSFMFKANMYLIGLGSLIEKQGANSYKYQITESDGMAKLVPLVFAGGKKQASAIETFLSRSNLLSLQEQQPALMNKTTVGQLYEAILNPETGYVLKMDTKKNLEGRWATEVLMLPIEKPLSSDKNINVEEEIYSDFAKDYLDSAYETTLKIANALLTAKGLDPITASSSTAAKEVKPADVDKSETEAKPATKKLLLEEESSTLESNLGDIDPELAQMFGEDVS